VQDLSQNYADPAIAGRQRRTVKRELVEMYKGKVRGYFALAGRVINQIKEKEPEWGSATLLDIACGSAYYSEVVEFLCPGWIDYVGMDYNSGMVELAHKCYPDIRVERGNILDIPFERDSFDIVLSSATIGHVKDWSKAVQELVRVTRTWLILHRNPVWLDENKLTEQIVRCDYEVDVVVTQFRGRDLIDGVTSLGMVLTGMYGMGEWGIPGTFTYLFKKEVRASDDL